MPDTRNVVTNRRPRRRRRRVHFPWLFTFILIVTVALGFSLSQYWQDLEEQATQTEPEIPAGSAAIGDTLTIAAAGDVSISPELLRYAVQPDGSYDFSAMFLDVSPLLSDADLTVANLEANICDSDFTGDNFRAPKSLLTALRTAGVDILQTANSASIYNGLSGLTSTHEAVEAAGMKAVGTFPTDQARKDSGGFTLVEIKGFRVAFVAFTKGVGNLRLPEGAESSVNLLYTDYNTTYQDVDTDSILSVLDRVKDAKPDITIALLHWGSEYDTGISRTQKTIASLLMDNGVDAILGTHPHILGQVDSVSNPGTLTAYSLGDLLRTDDSASAKQSMVLKLEFTKTQDGTVVTSWSYTPIYVATAQDAGSPQVLHVANAIGRYEAGLMDRISDELYQTLLTVEEKVASQLEVTEE